MEKIKNKFYLYRHIRLDRNEVFYVGIGKKHKENFNNHNSEYRRAYAKGKDRSELWKKVTNKSKYRVEIVFESDNYNFIKDKEKEFISLYGRKNLGMGTLVNLTDGGEGTIGRIPTKTAIQKTKEAHMISIYHKDTKETFSSIVEAAYKYDISPKTLSCQLRKQIPSCVFQYIDESLIKPYTNSLYIKILQKSTNKVFKTISEVCKELNISSETIKKHLSDPNSDFICLNRIFEIKKNVDKRSTYVLDIETGVIYNSIKKAWEQTEKIQTYDSFRSSVSKKLNFRYTFCDENGFSLKRTTRLPKSDKQKESSANVWKNKKIPEYMKKAIKEAIALKVIQKSTGLIFDSIKEASNCTTYNLSTFRKKLNSCLPDFDFEYLDKTLNIKKEKIVLEKKLSLKSRNLKNISNKTSKYVGVSWDKSKKKWVVQGRKNNGEKVFLGRYDDEEIAAKAYQNHLNTLKEEIILNWKIKH